MTEHRVSSLLLRTPEGWAILTDRDLRAKVVAARSSYDAPAIASATAPARTLPASTLAGDALLEMFAQGVHHFPVTDGDRVIGVVTDTDLMGIGRHTPFAIKSAIERADTREAVIAAGRELPNVVVALVDSNADPVSVGGVIALVIDALTERLVLLAGRSMGDAPAGFAWLSLGSAARHEQSLRTDQDHALAYELPAGATDEDVDGFFADLGEFVTSGLEAVGIPRCTGDAMVVHPAMRRSLEQWTERFRRWMNEPDLDARILSSIGFDFRRVAGPLDAEPPLDAAVREARAHPAFVDLLARGALNLKPPTGFLRDLVVEGKGEHAGQLDVKHGGITIITNLARAVGIAAGTTSKGTLPRLDAAAAAGTLNAQVAGELSEAFRFLWQIRLRHQAAQVEAGTDPGRLRRPQGARPARPQRAEGVVPGHPRGADVRVDRVRRRRHGSGQSRSVPIAWNPPSTWITSPEIPPDRSESRKAMVLPTGVGSSMSQPSGARRSHVPPIRSNPGIPLPAIVLIGPALTVFTRIPFGPRSRAR